MRPQSSAAEVLPSPGTARCPSGAHVSIEDCYACPLECEVGGASAGERPVEGDTLDQLRARLATLMRPV